MKRMDDLKSPLIIDEEIIFFLGSFIVGLMHGNLKTKFFILLFGQTTLVIGVQVIFMFRGSPLGLYQFCKSLDCMFDLPYETSFQHMR